MSGQVAGLVGKKILGETAKNHFGQEDPYFEEVPASRLSRAFGKKTQKRRKAIPPGLSDNDAKVLTKAKRRAYRLDYSLFSLCGIRFGWGSVIALFPFIGDGADTLLGLMVLGTCEQIDGGLPASLRVKMLINIALDFVIGLVPFAGDIADALYKCNSRNAVLLEKHLREKGAKELARQKADPTAHPDISLGDEFDRYEHGVTGSPAASNEHELQATGGRNDVEHSSRPNTATNPQKDRSERGWFGGSKNRDVEQGHA